MLLIDDEALPALPGHALPELVGVAAVVFFHVADQLLGAFLLQEVTREVLEHFLLFGESEVHLLHSLSGCVISRPGAAAQSEPEAIPRAGL